MPRLRALAPVLTTVLVFGVAGCGGSKPSGSSAATSTSSGFPASSSTTAKAPIEAPGKVNRIAGLLGDATSAGTGESYAPTGKIVADSGFRPDADGFAFENYGNDAHPVNLRPANVQDIFGSQVCAVGSGRSCQLIPAAKLWMDQANESMAGGHCMGFSVTALRFFAKQLRPDPFGASRTIALPVQGNIDLQSLIAEDFAYQSLPSVTDKTVQGSPTAVLDALVKALNADDETYTLGIFKADGTGGHAITPFAVEDAGGGQAKILVYDNNFPGVIREVDVDTKADRWHYVGGINPSDTDEVYDGDASTKSMSLLPTTPGEGRQPCPFCPREPKADPAYPVPDRLKYIEVVLRGTSANHPHLVFTDEQGRKTAFTGGRFVNEVPGIAYVSGRRGFPGSPTLGAQFPQFDLLAHRSSHPKARLVTLGTGWIGLRPGDPIALRLTPQSGTAEVSSPGGKRITTDAAFAVSLDSSPIGPGSKSRAYFGAVKNVDADSGQTLRFHYLRPKSRTLPVDILDASGATVTHTRVSAR
jgi:hypothetical protein